MNCMIAGKGQHITAEFWHCQCPPQKLNDVTTLREYFSDIITTLGLTLVGVAEHSFPSSDDLSEQNGGVTLSFLLAESHFCLHTWANEKTITLDIYVCNFLTNNSQKAKKLFDFCHEYFAPADYNVNYLSRNHFPPNK